MYEDWFGLRCRPFSATPDPDCWISVPSMQEAFDQLTASLESGQGISLLTAPAGMGKSLVCLRLAAVLGDRFTCALLPNANFVTRRSLLQAILYELGHPYANMSEQELRLALTTHARAMLDRQQEVLLVVDEGHLLSDRLLQELRALTNLSHEGRPMFRLVVAGELALEERLAGPQLSAFNQRVGCQAVLPPLTRDESRHYIVERILRAGGVASEIFTREAIELICRASDGNPRCLNQLADHSLVLAGAREENQADVQTVGAALDDLRQLPLCWSEPPTTDVPIAEHPHFAEDAPLSEQGRSSADATVTRPHASGTAGNSTADDPCQPDNNADDVNTDVIAIEIGVGASGDSVVVARGAHVVSSPGDAGNVCRERQAAGIPGEDGRFAYDDNDTAWTEEPVFDRYAWLDAGLPLDGTTGMPTGSGQLVQSGRIRAATQAVGGPPAPARLKQSLSKGNLERSPAHRPDLAPAETESQTDQPEPDQPEPDQPEPRVIRLIDCVEPLVQSALETHPSLECPPQLVGPVAATDDLEQAIGSLVLDTCLDLSAALASRENLPDGWIVPLPDAAVGFDSDAEISGPHVPPVFDVVEPEPNDLIEHAGAPLIGSGSCRATETDNGDRDPASTRARLDSGDRAVPRTSYARLFSDLRRRRHPG